MIDAVGQDSGDKCLRRAVHVAAGLVDVAFHLQLVKLVVDRLFVHVQFAVGAFEDLLVTRAHVLDVAQPRHCRLAGLPSLVARRQ